MLPARTVNHRFPFILTSTSLLYERTAQTKQQKETQESNSIEISNFLYETIWSKKSVSFHSQARNQQKA